MMKKFFYLSLISMVLLFSSCATIFTGTRDAVRFKSTPEGATVYKDGHALGKTPLTTHLKRSVSDVEVTVELEGYETEIILLDREFNFVSVINLYNLLFWGIDVATGSLMKYGRRSYDIELREEKDK